MTFKNHERFITSNSVFPLVEIHSRRITGYIQETNTTFTKSLYILRVKKFVSNIYVVQV